MTRMPEDYLSFDGMADQYDDTRIYDPQCFNAALDFLVDRFPPDRFKSVFEPGVGTGRIALPLTRRGYNVTGLDVSPKMLAILQGRLRQDEKPLSVTPIIGDVQSLPFGDGVFDWAIAVHLFCFVRGWQQAVREMLRVVRPGGAFVLLHTGTGTEIPALTERYEELCRERGHHHVELGARTAAVVDYLGKLEYKTERVEGRWRWTARLKLDTVLGQIESRSISQTRFTPEDVHRSVMKQLREEMRSQYGSLEATVEVPNQIYVVMASK